MALIIDAAVITENASLVKRMCDGAGVAPLAVFKPAYALDPIIGAIASAGLTRFAASSIEAAVAVERVTGQICGLIGPAAYSVPATGDGRSRMVTSASQAADALKNGHGPVWLAVMTSDGRDGVPDERLLDVIAGLTKGDPMGRVGLALNWGCFRGAPTRAELRRTGLLLSEASKLARRRLPASVGGSALLPLLDRLGLPGACELRVGEAILTGNIPDADGATFGFHPPMHLDATIVDIQEGCHRVPRLVLDQGWTSIEPADVALCGLCTRLHGASTDFSFFDLLEPGCVPNSGDRVRLRLGYKSTLRALLNRNIKTRLKPTLRSAVGELHDELMS